MTSTPSPKRSGLRNNQLCFKKQPNKRINLSNKKRTTLLIRLRLIFKNAKNKYLKNSHTISLHIQK